MRCSPSTHQYMGMYSTSPGSSKHSYPSRSWNNGNLSLSGLSKFTCMYTCRVSKPNNYIILGKINNCTFFSISLWRKTSNRYKPLVIGVSLSEPHIDHDNGPRARNNATYLCIYLCIIYPAFVVPWFLRSVYALKCSVLTCSRAWFTTALKSWMAKNDMND